MEGSALSLPWSESPPPPCGRVGKPLLFAVETAVPAAFLFISDWKRQNGENPVFSHAVAVPEFESTAAITKNGIFFRLRLSGDRLQQFRQRQPFSGFVIKVNIGQSKASRFYHSLDLAAAKAAALPVRFHANFWIHAKTIEPSWGIAIVFDLLMRIQGAGILDSVSRHSHPRMATHHGQRAFLSGIRYPSAAPFLPDPQQRRLHRAAFSRNIAASLRRLSSRTRGAF